MFTHSSPFYKVFLAAAVIFFCDNKQTLAQGETQNPTGGNAGLFWKTVGNATTNSGVNFIGTTDAVDFVVRTNNTERARVTSAGNVGIGITGPLNKADIAAAARSGSHATGSPLYVTGTLGAASSGIEFRHDNGTQGIGFGYNTIYAAGSSATQDLGLSSKSTGNLNFSTNATQRMIILGSNGNVGIGTTTPGYRLDLASGTFAFGNSNVRTETRDNAGLQGNAGAQSGFFETSTPTNYPTGASSWWHLIDSRHSNNGNNYALQLSGSFFDQELWMRKTNGAANTAWSRVLTSSNLNTQAWSLLGNSGTNAATNYIGTSDAVDFVVRTSGSERLRVSSGGNVGIGATAPAVRLSVGGNGTNVYATDMWVENNLHVQGNETLTQGGRGRMRIGTAWGFMGLYTEGSSSGAANDLVLGSGSGYVRVGPNAGSGQHLRWANSILRDDQGGAIELGGSDPLGTYGSGTPYIDWHVNDGYNRDYDIREIAATDGYGPTMSWISYEGANQYPYLQLDWIGTYDNWADVSAWQYWANSSNSLYWDTYSDLDLIDKIRPKAIVNPKTKEVVMINDPLTMPSFITKQSKGNSDQYIYSLTSAISLNTGAIRQLRTETKTCNEGQDARLERLEKMVEALSGQKLDDIQFISGGTVYKGLSTYVVMDGRITADSKISINFKGSVGSYKISEQTNGSFRLSFDAPLPQDAPYTYSSALK